MSDIYGSARENAAPQVRQKSLSEDCLSFPIEIALLVAKSAQLFLLKFRALITNTAACSVSATPDRPTGIGASTGITTQVQRIYPTWLQQ
jgi:hypothetical protein